MYERPQIRVVQGQHVESEREITGSEAEDILRKYGYSSNGSDQTQLKTNDPVSNDEGLTFEEMLSRQESKLRDEKLRQEQRLNGPRPITFNSNNYSSETKYGSDESGFGFKIEITTDMKLPKY